MLKRAFDVVCAGVGLVFAAPLIAVAALGIRLVSPGSVLYRAVRVGRGGGTFTMYKLRTMRADHDGSLVSPVGDPRVFPLGRLLRLTKIDELPQLVNVLRGEMSIIGPRPEDPAIVARHYAPEHFETLEVRPGLSSPGSLYYDAHVHRLLAVADPERCYVERILPLKLALDLVYVRRASLRYDLAILVRTVVLIAGRIAGRRRFAEPPEMAAAGSLTTRALHTAGCAALTGRGRRT